MVSTLLRSNPCPDTIGCSILFDFTGLRVKNQERFWSMPLPALTRVDLGEDTMGEVTMEEVTMVEVTINKHMVVGTAASLPRLTASCPAMESSVRRNILWLDTEY